MVGIVIYSAAILVPFGALSMFPARWPVNLFLVAIIVVSSVLGWFGPHAAEFYVVPLLFVIVPALVVLVLRTIKAPRWFIWLLAAGHVAFVISVFFLLHKEFGDLFSDLNVDFGDS